LTRVHVALNLVFLHARSGGVGRYARELVPALLAAAPDLRVTAFVGDELPTDVRRAPWASSVRWVRFPVRTSSGPRGAFALATATQWGTLPLAAERRKVDLVHGLCNVAPLWTLRAARVVTLLDVVWLRYPDALEPAATRGMRMTALPSARRAHRVVAISHAAKAHIVDRVGLDPARIDVTPLGVSDEPLAAPSPEVDLRRRFGLGAAEVVLSVSQKREHKNLAGLIAGFARMASDKAVLVLPGDPTPHERDLRALAGELGLGDRVRFLGWVSDSDLEGLYRLSAAFVLPSLEEGFGLPVLEAMRRDVPVACSRTSSLGEVAGDAAELFDPRDPADMSRALERVLESPRRRADLVARGRVRCRAYTWRATAEATLASYERAVRARRA
jgi:glycosyltransferase involved in cell wall biosynthesis